MSNFEYIISGLPWLTLDYRYESGKGYGTVVDEIRGNLSEKDGALVDDLLRGFDEASLTEDFYAGALRHKLPFLREYFRFDLNLRNAKVRFLNKALGRDAELDVMTGLGSEDDTDLDIDGYRFTGGEFEEEAAVQAALDQDDLLSRERALDEIVWAKVDSLATFHYFDITAVLAYLAKLHIVDRWLSLDAETGRELFRKLVSEVRGTFKGVEYNG